MGASAQGRRGEQEIPFPPHYNGLQGFVFIPIPGFPFLLE